MKESMFDGPEVLDKMLQDADEANKDPDEVDNTIDEKEAEEDAEELKNIMSDLKDQVSGENDKDSNNTSEDANNNVCDENLSEDAPPKEKQILSFEEAYNKPSTESSTLEQCRDETMDVNIDNKVITNSSTSPRF